MALPVEIVVVGQPVSVDSGNVKRKREWQERVRSLAMAVCGNSHVLIGTEVKVSVLWIFSAQIMDTDNVSKYILDALNKVVYVDDRQVGRLLIERIPFGGIGRIRRTPPELAAAISVEQDVVYIRVEHFKKSDPLIL